MHPHGKLLLLGQKGKNTWSSQRGRCVPVGRARPARPETAHKIPEKRARKREPRGLPWGAKQGCQVSSSLAAAMSSSTALSTGNLEVSMVMS